jgi:hypothetical protein
MYQGVALAMAVVMSASGFLNSGGVQILDHGHPEVRPTTAETVSSALSIREITNPWQKARRELGTALASQPDSAALSPAETSRRLHSAFAALEASSRELEKDRFDTQAIVDRVGQDPLKLFAWVWHETSFVPYRGLLRGEVGVMMDRLGNSLDRAALLSALLRRAGYQTRLVRGRLSQPQIDQMVRDVRGHRPTRAEREPNAAISAENFLASFSADHGLNPALTRARFAALTREQEKSIASIKVRALQQAKAVSATLGSLPSPIDAGALHAAFSDHWWIQWQDGTHWVDMDATFSKPGQSRTGVTEVFDLEQFTDLPADLQHVIDVRVIVEAWHNGGLRQHQVLHHELRPSLLFGKSIEVSHFPMHWPKDFDPFNTNNPLQRLPTAVMLQRQWVPVLTIGNEPIVQSSFTVAGDVNPNPFGPLLGSSGQSLGNRVSGILDRASGDTPFKDYLTAEWIEYEIRSPGYPKRIIRREIFDLMGPAARASGETPPPAHSDSQRLQRGLSLLGQTEILPLASHLSQEFVQHIVARALLANKDSLLAIVDKKSSSGTSFGSADLERLTAMPSALYSLALARQQWSRFSEDIYLDTPNVLSMHSNVRVDATGMLSSELGFDIVANDVAVSPAAKENPFLIRLEQGILDTNIEAFLAQSVCGANDPKSECGDVHNTAELYAASKRKHVEWLALRNDTDPLWNRLEVTADERARLREDVAAGYAVLVSPGPSVSAEKSGILWWRVDLRSGQSLGIGGRGWGQAMIDWGMVIKNVRIFVKIVQAVLCLYLVGTSTGIPIDVVNSLTLVCFVYGTAAFGGVYAGAATVNAGAVMSLAADVISLLVAGARIEYARNPSR